jgi:Polysaccharide deacetylase
MTTTLSPFRFRRLMVVATVMTVILLGGCRGGDGSSAARRPGTNAASATSTGPGAPRQLAVRVRRVRWRGPVEHIFFHPLVVDPSRAFHGSEGAGFRNYFVTVREFRRTLRELYRRHWVLADIESAARGTLRVPVGKRPLVMSVDDLNFYDYMRAVGPGYRLALDRSGRVAVELRDRSGRHPHLSRSADIVPILDDFATAHPDFSPDGAKGVIALTGYEGALGERTNVVNARDIGRRRMRARRVVKRMKATGWRFASHSWGHIDLSRASAAWVRRDSSRWRREVEPLIGPTDVYVYPFGAEPPDQTRAMLHREFGFKIFCSIDSRPTLKRVGDIIAMSRRHIDGYAFEGQRVNLKRLFNVSRVVDRRARR